MSRGAPADQGVIGLDSATLLVVAALAAKQGIPVSTMAAELIQDGITARSTRQTKQHQCKPGDINERFCRICSAPMT